MDCTLPGSPVHGILQARILEWVAILFSRGSSWPSKQTQVSCITHLLSLWDLVSSTSAHPPHSPETGHHPSLFSLPASHAQSTTKSHALLILSPLGTKPHFSPSPCNSSSPCLHQHQAALPPWQMVPPPQPQSNCWLPSSHSFFSEWPSKTYKPAPDIPLLLPW